LTVRRRSAKSGEFATIANLFRPLTRGHPAALDLGDDAACIRPRRGCDLVVTADALVAGVHFFADDPPAAIAQKALRVNLSDLAAKGAKPVGYFLALARPPTMDDRALKAFARGLARDGELFGIPLLGGDTTATPGPLTIAITALGEVAYGTMLRRNRALPGDDLWLSGTLGDGALGLQVAKGLLAPGKALLARYRLPQPRLALGAKLIGRAHACMDVSDGLAADLGHMCKRSRVAATVELTRLPLSRAAAQALARDANLLETIATGGDDYELLFAAPPAARAAILRIAAAAKTQATRIGRFESSGTAVRFVDAAGRTHRFARAGFTHF
jgi:thiamine-monophosphate kinase